MLKLVLLWLVVVLTVAFWFSMFIENADVNRDGIVTITDYTLIRLDVLGIINAGREADVNRDGHVDASDCNIVKNILLSEKQQVNY